MGNTHCEGVLVTLFSHWPRDAVPIGLTHEVDDLKDIKDEVMHQEFVNNSLINVEKGTLECYVSF